MSDITKRYGIITGGTGSFGSIQHTDGDEMGTSYQILDSSRNLQFLTSVSASGDIQGGAGTFGGNVSVAGNLTVNGTTTSVNSTAIDLGDRIINLNSSNATGDAGFYVNDTSTDQTGSLLWDSSADKWMGGLSGSEVVFVDVSSTQTMTNKTMTSPTLNTATVASPDIDGGTIDGATIATSNVTVGAGKTLDVSAGTLTLANNQISGDKVEGGTIASITISQLGGAMDANSQAMTNVNVDSGAIDGTVIGANSAAAGTFAAVVATTMAATSLSASSFVSGSSFEVDGQASIKYQSSALDFSNGSAGAALSTSHFSSSVELQGPTLEVSGAAQVGSLTINGTALTATAAELNYLDNDDLTAADLTKLAAITATAAEINDLATNAVDSSDFTKLSEVTATSTELNYVDVTAGTATASKAVVLDASKNIATIGTVGCGAITSTGASSFGTVSASVGVFAPHARLSGSTGIVKVYNTSMQDGTYTDLLSLDDANGRIEFDPNNELSYWLYSGNGFNTGGATWASQTLQATSGNSITIQNASNSDQNMELDTNSSGSSVEFKNVDSGGILLSDYDGMNTIMTIVSSSAGGSSINMYTGSISNLQDPSSAQDAATKAYVDAQVTAQDLDFQGDSGGALSIDLDSESLTIAGATGLSTAGSSNTLTVSLDINNMNALTTVNDADTIAVYDADAMAYKKVSRANFIESSALDAINIDGGAIDGTVIGANSAAAGTFAAATASSLSMGGHVTFSTGATIKTGGNSVELGESGNKFAAVYATNVYTGDMHLKNERGDWTIFEESDHLRIRNNLTGQTFKMGMTLIDDQ